MPGQKRGRSGNGGRGASKKRRVGKKSMKKTVTKWVKECKVLQKKVALQVRRYKDAEKQLYTAEINDLRRFKVHVLPLGYQQWGTHIVTATGKPLQGFSTEGGGAAVETALMYMTPQISLGDQFNQREGESILWRKTKFQFRFFTQENKTATNGSFSPCKVKIIFFRYDSQAPVAAGASGTMTFPQNLPTMKMLFEDPYRDFVDNGTVVLAGMYADSITGMRLRKSNYKGRCRILYTKTYTLPVEFGASNKNYNITHTFRPKKGGIKVLYTKTGPLVSGNADLVDYPISNTHFFCAVLSQAPYFHGAPHNHPASLPSVTWNSRHYYDA